MHPKIQLLNFFFYLKIIISLSQKDHRKKRSDPEAIHFGVYKVSHINFLLRN
jgi:hypothetical protein